MRKSFVLPFAASAFVLLSAAANAPVVEEAAKAALRAEKAMAKKKPDLASAVAQAEAAVAASPRDASYRMLLGRAYLESGRFRSAASSFADALALDPSRGGAALSLALTRIGQGDMQGARAALDRYGPLIAPGDRGLAIALAGDPTKGVGILEEAVRQGGADAKTRQNLALSYALAGRWQEARLMASYDLDPQTVSRRILDWSRFAGGAQAPAQVAELLGVQPGADAGQPERLALNMPEAPAVQMAQAAAPPPPVPMTETPPAQIAAVSAEANALFAPTAPVQLAAPSPIVQTIAKPRPTIAAVPARFQRAAFVQPSGGNFVVQVGAYDSLGVAQDAWGRYAHSIGMLHGVTPSTATIVKGAVTFTRLSVAGFATRADAAAMCEQLRTQGGQCFVRVQAGDAPLQWAGHGNSPRFAAR